MMALLRKFTMVHKPFSFLSIGFLTVFARRSSSHVMV